MECSTQSLPEHATEHARLGPWSPPLPTQPATHALGHVALRFHRPMATVPWNWDSPLYTGFHERLPPSNAHFSHAEGAHHQRAAGLGTMWQRRCRHEQQLSPYIQGYGALSNLQFPSILMGIDFRMQSPGTPGSCSYPVFDMQSCSPELMFETFPAGVQSFHDVCGFQGF